MIEWEVQQLAQAKACNENEDKIDPTVSSTCIMHYTL